MQNERVDVGSCGLSRIKSTNAVLTLSTWPHDTVYHEKHDQRRRSNADCLGERIPMYVMRSQMM